MTDHALDPVVVTPPVSAPRDVQLHPIGRRLMHWVNAAAIIIMIGSGWRIYNSYPALPLDFGFPPVITLGGDISKPNFPLSEEASC
jgi:thiosulfate reductase cytochrome b subunit